jgi:carbon monoxide dehydrogenase subunit G
MLDVERVAPTVPGAQVLERTGEDAYKVAIKVKVGPMSMTYRGDVEITERDDAAHRAVMKARAKESRGQGMADADVTMVLDEEDGRTAATVTTEVELSGKVATMGQGVLQDVSGRLVQTFASNLAAMLEGAPVEETAAPSSPEVQAKTASEMATAAGDTAGASGPAGAGATAGVGAAASAGAADGPGTAASARAADASGAPGTTRATGTADAGEPGQAAATGEDRPAGGTGKAPPRPPGADALDLGAMGGAMLAERLKDPRRLGAVLAVVALIAFWLGRRSNA